MTQQSASVRVARAAAATDRLANRQRSSLDVGQEARNATLASNRELFEATIAAVLAGLPLRETAEAMQAGWPELHTGEAMFKVEGYLERQAGLDRDELHRTLTGLAKGRGG
jgi:hypothetical protein